jgi:TetR/AcrR family transcriptional regulator
MSSVSRAEERAAQRSAAVQRSRTRIANQVRLMLDAALRLIREKGDAFTTQELVKEAGVALQTFYRYFVSKDELLLAVIADAMTDACTRWSDAARELPDPVARLRFYITGVIDVLDSEGGGGGAARFVVSTHWRLHRIFPDELAEAEKPLVDLLLGEINAAVDAGLLRPADPQSAAWFITELVRSVYHYYAYAERQADVKEQLWEFCLTALGGTER